LLSDYVYAVPVVFCYIIDENDRVLLIKRSHPPSQSEITVVGGKKEPGEDLVTACKREVFEETGLTLGNVRLRGVVNFRVEGRTYETVCFYFESRDFSGEVVSGEEGDLQWCAVTDSFCKEGISDYYKRISPFLFESDTVFTGMIEVAPTGNILRCSLHADESSPGKTAYQP
jgi:8-oxo-dGTP diphosphatase